MSLSLGTRTRGLASHVYTCRGGWIASFLHIQELSQCFLVSTCGSETRHIFAAHKGARVLAMQYGPGTFKASPGNVDGDNTVTDRVG
eukprot:800847-Prorocentrum_minimum.AAC.6